MCPIAAAGALGASIIRTLACLALSDSTFRAYDRRFFVLAGMLL